MPQPNRVSERADRSWTVTSYTVFWFNLCIFSPSRSKFANSNTCATKTQHAASQYHNRKEYIHPQRWLSYQQWCHQPVRAWSHTVKPHSTFRFGGLGFTRERFFLQLKVPFQHIIWRAGRVDFQLKARRFSLAWVTRDDDHKIRSAEARDYDVSLALMGSKN